MGLLTKIFWVHANQAEQCITLEDVTVQRDEVSTPCYIPTKWLRWSVCESTYGSNIGIRKVSHSKLQGHAELSIWFHNMDLVLSIEKLIQIFGWFVAQHMVPQYGSGSVKSETHTAICLQTSEWQIQCASRPWSLGMVRPYFGFSKVNIKFRSQEPNQGNQGNVVDLLWVLQCLTRT